MIAEKMKPSENLPLISQEASQISEGIYYFNARWYDPETGGFITEDPVKDGLLWYAYVSNNPLKFVDPTGLLTDDHRKELEDMRENGAPEDAIDDAREAMMEAERKRIEALKESLEDDSLSEAHRNFTQGMMVNYMGLYNRDVVPKSVRDYGGEGLSGDFEDVNPYNDLGQFPHSGIDTVGGDGLETPWYTIYENSENQESNPIILSIPGTNYRMRVKHGDNVPIMKLDNRAEYNDMVTFSPGEEILPFPVEGHPDKYDPHFHIEIRTTDKSAASPLVHPIGLRSGSYEDYLFDYGDRIAPMRYRW